MGAIKTTQLYDDEGYKAASDADMDSVLSYIKGTWPELESSVHFEDNDDHGCEHYIKIKGELATIYLNKDWGGMCCPSRSIVCSIILNYTGQQNIDDVEFGHNYERNIKLFIDASLPLLTKKYECTRIECDCGDFSGCDCNKKESAAFFLASEYDIDSVNNDAQVRERGLTASVSCKFGDRTLIKIEGYCGNLCDKIIWLLSGVQQKEGEIFYDILNRAKKVVLTLPNNLGRIIEAGKRVE